MSFKVSIYSESIKGIAKSDVNTKKICKLIANYRYDISLLQLAEYIEKQYVWCPATFKGNRKCQDKLDSIQLFALDFDGGISYDDVVQRAEKFKLPVALSYETMSSVNFSRFRVVFACNQVITDKNLALLIQICLCSIYPEADTTSKDFSKLYFPGRNVIYNENKYFTVYDLLLSTLQYLDEYDNTNKSRKLKAIANKTKVVLRNNTFALIENPEIYNAGASLSSPTGTEIEDEIFKRIKNEDIRTITIYNNRVDVQKSSILLFSTDKSIIYSEKRDISLRVNLNNNCICKLLSDFMSGIRITHDEWFGLALNLIHIKGGKELLTRTFEKYSDRYGDIARKMEQISWAYRNNCKPQRCDNYCPYSDTCCHKSTMCYTLKNCNKEIISVDDNTEYTDIDTMRENIRYTLDMCLNNSGVNVIKAPTGAGKTYAYLNAVKKSCKQTIVAVPNSKLMYSVADTAKDMGIDYITTPIIDELLMSLNKETAENIRHHYMIGDDMAINALLRECDSPRAKEYLKTMDKIRSFKGQLVITTHARLLNMKEDYLRARNVIIDEDILTTMLQVNQISVNDICSLLNKNTQQMPVNPMVETRLKRIAGVQGYEMLDEFTYNIDECERAALNNRIDSRTWSSSIYHAIYSRCFYREKGSDTIYFLYKKELPDCSCTIFSATADKTLYEKIFGRRLYSFNDLGLLKYRGKLILHPDETYSRECFSSKPELLKNIRKKHANENIITFKALSEPGEIYLGASQGFNYLQGQDITVAGTFHRPEYVYKLFAMITGNSNTGDSLAVRRVSRNGYNFPFMTFSDELLRTIQLWMIESESEQAVGRARLVSNECTVNLYSNLPLRQCRIEKE